MATNESAKRKRALDLIESDDLAVSLQVINEVSRVLSEKGKVAEDILRSVIQGFYIRYPSASTRRI